MSDYANKPWLERYPSDIQPSMDEIPFKHLVDFYNHANKKYASQPAFSSFDVELNYQQTQDFSTQIAAWLQQHATLGANIAISSPNCLQYPVIVQAIHRAGMVVTNLNPLLTSRELGQILADSGAEIIFVWNGSAHTLDGLTIDNNLNQVVVMSLAEYFPGLKRCIIDFVLKRVKKIIPAFTLDNFSVTPFDAVTNNNHILDQAHLSQINHQSLAFLQYTGGTTGQPKGVMLSHGNMLSNLTQATQFLPKEVMSKAKNVITALPLYHIFALTANYYVMYGLGVKNVLITNPRDIPAFIKILLKNPPHIITGVNTLFNALLNNEKLAKVDFSQLKISLGGGMSVQKATSDQWLAATNCFILEAYGLSETSPAVTINPHNITNYNASIGLPLPDTEIDILDDEGNSVAIEESGELVVKGPQVMSGYWHNEAETTQAFTKDGWFKTGDIAKMDAEGFLYLLDRKKDMIVVSGFNVYPAEIEQVISQIDGVLECACIGIPDEHSGEIVKIFIVQKPQFNLNKEAIIDHCKHELSAYKVPKQIEFSPELPKTNIGKVLRRALR